MNTPDPSTQSLTQLLALMNQLHLKAFTAASNNALIFIILNETRKLVAYDRALLWTVKNGRPTCMGISGQTHPESESPVIRDVAAHLKTLKTLDEPQVIDLKGYMPGSTSVQKDVAPGIPSGLWMPVKEEGKTVLGLWLERWKAPGWTQEEIKVLTHLLIGYGAAWARHRPLVGFSWPTAQTIAITTAVVLIILFLIPVPLRVVAPCEIVANQPVLVTAPLEGIVAKMDIKPGETVTEGQDLFTYDKRVPLQELKIAEKQVEVTNAQLNRVLTLGLSDQTSLSETAVWKSQLAKDNMELDLARYHASQLDVKAPSSGVAIFDNPDEWRGKPVKVGERVLVLSKPGNTKVRIWIPDRDNVAIDKNRPVKVVLNISPLTSYYANLSYISDFSVLTDKGIPSFAGEAEWPPGEQPDVKLGLKGSAILYGENVSLLYWIIRKPWARLREIIGL